MSKGLKFIPTPTHINKVLIKEKLETDDRKLRLIWHIAVKNEKLLSILFRKNQN